MPKLEYIGVEHKVMTIPYTCLFMSCTENWDFWFELSVIFLNASQVFVFSQACLVAPSGQLWDSDGSNSVHNMPGSAPDKLKTAQDELDTALNELRRAPQKPLGICSHYAYQPLIGPWTESALSGTELALNGTESALNEADSAYDRQVIAQNGPKSALNEPELALDRPKPALYGPKSDLCGSQP